MRCRSSALFIPSRRHHSRPSAGVTAPSVQLCASGVLRGYLTGNPRGLTERDARIYYHYLETEHEQFCAIAQEIIAEKNPENGAG